MSTVEIKYLEKHVSQARRTLMFLVLDLVEEGKTDAVAYKNITIVPKRWEGDVLATVVLEFLHDGEKCQLLISNQRDKKVRWTWGINWKEAKVQEPSLTLNWFNILCRELCIARASKFDLMVKGWNLFFEKYAVVDEVA